MLISNKYNFIFIEMPKTASSSIRSKLECLQDVQHPMEKHASANRACKTLGENVFFGYLRFVVVREPTSWLKSFYRFYKGRSQLGRESKDSPNFISDESFAEFCEKASERKKGEPFGRVGGQSDRITNPFNGEVMVSKILKYEELSEQFKILSDELSFPFDHTLPKINVSTVPDEIHIDKTLRRFIEVNWAKDFEIYSTI